MKHINFLFLMIFVLLFTNISIGYSQPQLDIGNYIYQINNGTIFIMFSVANTGDTDLYGIHFELSDCYSGINKIDGADFDISPPFQTLIQAGGDTITTELRIPVKNTAGGMYQGAFYAYSTSPAIVSDMQYFMFNIPPSVFVMPTSMNVSVEQGKFSTLGIPVGFGSEGIVAFSDIRFAFTPFANAGIALPNQAISLYQQSIPILRPGMILTNQLSVNLSNLNVPPGIYVSTMTCYSGVTGDTFGQTTINVTVSGGSAISQYDLNNDTVIDMLDVQIAAANYGLALDDYDFNNDGVVNVEDVKAILRHFGEDSGY